MVDIFEIRNLDKEHESKMFDQFIVYYLEAFKDPNEREEPEQLEDNLRAQTEGPGQFRYHIALAVEELHIDKQLRVYGGIIFEYYPKSSCGMLSYVVVAPGQRGKGIFRRLYNYAIGRFLKDSEENGRELKAVFAEIRDPWKPSRFESQEFTRTRALIHSKLGAKLIDIPYIMPPLDENKSKLDDFLLVSYPINNKNHLSISTKIVVSFLEDYYRIFGIAKPSENDDYLRMIAPLNSEIYILKAISGLS
jgi:hypothetical protein